MLSDSRETSPALSIRGVGFAYRPEQPVLRDVSLDIAPGDLFGLLGPNGAGKTTLISLLAGLLPLSMGEIRVGDASLAEARRTPGAIALVPQDYAFYPMLTVAENLDFFAGVQGLGRVQARVAIESAIVFARLEKYVKRYAGELSGGLKRRLNLAIGLLSDPGILLLDEPTVGVDPQSRHFLLESIAALGKSGKTIIYTSHYMDEVEALCRHIAIIDGGRILVKGTLDALLDSHSAGEQVEASLRFQSPLPACVTAALREAYQMETDGDHSCRLTLASPMELSGVLARLQAADCQVVSVTCGQSNLEEVFMHLTRRSLRD